MPICIFGCVWKERNLKCFEDFESSMGDILTSFFHTLYLWTVAFLSPLFFFLFLVSQLGVSICILLAYLEGPYAFNMTKFTYKKYLRRALLGQAHCSVHDQVYLQMSSVC
jgi:hypothetical protein